MIMKIVQTVHKPMNLYKRSCVSNTTGTFKSLLSSWRRIATRSYRKNALKADIVRRSYSSVKYVNYREIMLHLTSSHKKILQLTRYLSQGSCVRWFLGNRVGCFLSAVCLSQKYDWELNGITDATLERCRLENEIDGINELMESTIVCPICQKRKVLHKKVAGVEYCECKEGNGVNWNNSYDGWYPFLEQENILVWRKPDQQYPHLYAYKVYGRYTEVSLCAFVETQLNTSYRTSWDPSALELYVLEADDALTQKDEKIVDKYSAQDLLYWLVKFPSFFANRDYVFKRRYRVDNARREVVIINETESTGVISPVQSIHRVQEYWSVMVVRATQPDLTQPGIEFILSYFDNPGTSLPSSITNFIASTAFPNFLVRLHDASITLQKRYEAGLPTYTSLPRVVLEKVLQQEQKQDQHRLETEEANSDKSLYEGIENTTAQILQLMEAIGEVSLVPQDKMNLLQEFDNILSQKLDGLDENNPIVFQIKATRKKIQEFIHNSKLKKEQSLSMMENQLKKKLSYRYDDSKHSHIMVHQLFSAVNSLLKEDLDMRTGKGLLKHDSSKMSSVKSSNKDAEHKTEIDPKSPPESNKGWGDWLYSTFVESPLGVFGASKKKPNSSNSSKTEESEKEQVKEESECDDCPEIQDSKRSDTQISSWQYYLYGWWPLPSVNSATTSEKLCDKSSNSKLPVINDTKDERTYQKVVYVEPPEVSNNNLNENVRHSRSRYEDAPEIVSHEQQSDTSGKGSWIGKPFTGTYKWLASFFTTSNM